MVKPEWGTKRTCPKCATRFYDLGKDDPVTCIECGNEWVPEPVLKSKQPLPFDSAKTDKEKADKEKDQDKDLSDDEDLDIDEDDEGSPDDDNDLGGDDDLGVKRPDDEDDEN
ncbi:TIGR02300 family protein [Stakelama marina]|uniref:TIGR02300 family protein n=1 Tax=Stakelama marina TaxID=2826939 RepID=A0A8T4IGB4_9SPHN|nr:TIGR02300 family protein [Stakelama marina]MBR0552115.1 TIGR02300 family protein [Stakelama marina]